MKNRRYIWMAMLVLFSLGSCNSFLDIKPEGELVQDEQFKDVQGYRDAMYGIYASMAQGELYGMMMNWGLADVLGQQFGDEYGQFADASDGWAGSKYAYIKYASIYDYKDQRMEKQIESVWTKLYECISYVNNVIVNIDREDLNKDPDLKLIKGEAYAVRAFLHFEVMRLFCDNYRMNPDAGGVPYAYTFDLSSKKVYTLAQCYDNVLADLSEAARSLAGDGDIYNTTTVDSYRRKRYSHCNLYAAWAIKARVFYTRGDLDSAAYYAEKVIASPGVGLTERQNFEHVKRYGTHTELIWGLFTNKMYTDYKELFLQSAVTLNATLRADIKALYEVSQFTADSKDLRYTSFFQDKGYEGHFFIRLLSPTEGASNKPTQYFNGTCLVRLPEMYYILAEANYSKDKEKALGYLNAVRGSRGLADIEASLVDSQDKFLKEMTRERTREFYGEGQMFSFYKCHNLGFRDFLDKVDVVPSKDVFVLPWPKSEQEYGVTNQ
ncbi:MULTISPECIES: RagB/SusD family nutrient uptake outer membrane protein [Butyricimonas]|jgi:hypothetical protein|uniref:RagB/SusD family nutrient uptake outer membrane protein n=1 Tax=Butyricimonas hominis TaxID=2763032 RepID=A0ABR7D6T4_9BACT|nr:MULTISPECIES: RagB/SusD family nutrient uptake outer membrane protein [Butyricimonas]MBC5623200.1 RagB/SusD family nutrient uptake outer membrane protein [Butyricimonas hominis]MCB6973353.1 RagB/SusD family nutrient uptake outer membrane protein [Butyricimonas synergistica]MCG4520176.1 RagB/SusD family nutrient uptake outer membrane protein [Butyricimonas sp. DFI.6.44]